MMAVFILTHQLFTAAGAFSSPPPHSRYRFSTIHMARDPVTAFYSIRGPVQDYLNGAVPAVKEWQHSGALQDFLLKYGHPITMVLLLSMMMGGGYLGWQIRKGHGMDKTWYTFGEVVKRQHPKVMLVTLPLFFIGGQTGLLSTLVQGRSIFSSGHSVTAAMGLAALTLQATVPLFFRGNPKLRTFHAYFGTATLALLAVHGAQGINLLINF